MTHSFDRFSARYGHFPESLRLEMLSEARKMFEFGYNCYMECAFPQDELDPIHCRGRGPDVANPDNININDVLGDYSLTLVDALDTLAIMGNASEFRRAVQLVVDHVNFDKPNTVQESAIRLIFCQFARKLATRKYRNRMSHVQEMHFKSLFWGVHESTTWETYFSLSRVGFQIRISNTFQVFEANIRALGGLLSAHLLMEDPSEPFGRLSPDWYMGDLLTLAHDLADRLLVAFATENGIPHPRVNLLHGVPEDGYKESCTAGIGSLILELGMLSR